MKANENENGMRVNSIPPWTRSASDLRGASPSPRPSSVTPGPQHHHHQEQQQQQQQQNARLGLTLDTSQYHDRDVRRGAHVTPDGAQQQQQQRGARLTLEAAHQDRGVGDDDDVSFAGGSGDGRFSSSGRVSASSAVRYDAW